MIVELYRHGPTPGNLRGAYIGRTDEPLDEGWASLVRPIDEHEETVFVTRRRRTAQTARLFFPNARQVVVEGLEEMDFGAFEGRSAADMERDDAYRAWVDSWCEGPCPGGEDRAAFERRCAAAFERLVTRRLEGGESRVRLVVHGGTVMALMHAFADPPAGYFDRRTEPGGLWTLLVDPALWGRRRFRVVGGNGRPPWEGVAGLGAAIGGGQP